jgi:hypothetical protein
LKESKHASWLNIAEIELSVLARQGLAHNIATIEDLCQQVQQWQAHRNQRVGTVNWQFRTADARIKLKRLYPVQQPDDLRQVELVKAALSCKESQASCLSPLACVWHLSRRSM